MNKILKVTIIVISLLILIIASGLSYLKFALPDVGPAPEISVEGTEQQIERGRYLANHVSVCIDCHSTRDWSKFAGPPIPGTEGRGGELFDQSFGFPGRFVSKNITPHHLEGWTDGEIFRAITTGVSKHGTAFFPVMPYKYYGKMDTEDIKSIIAYVRSLSPIAFDPDPSAADFPVNFIINTMPAAASPKKMPDPKNVVEYGAYVANAAGCAECHTKQENGTVVGELFAGGFEFNMGNGYMVSSMNITPHETGIGKWTKAAFIQRFKLYTDTTYVLPDVDMAKGEFQTVMPWTMYAGMTEQDLGAIYEYLQTIDPVPNTVERWKKL
ncbi:c-type cytochrome [Imperialibacter roseus]|uniref:C-type cytochrome n=1 Tax=Imperialibacter roseus TaxID=1324217 RepID=A0ABZ0IWI1_9BACT|nr:c-type cytochrome [Imperialibacter roseus]WOK08474.1 c-type cytochrome [Imperialibacter roseus]|tara:strand:+ start:17131 stop:18108 length:978 start_codon:yes stop_codon:yes gene_type:complete